MEDLRRARRVLALAALAFPASGFAATLGMPAVAGRAPAWTAPNLAAPGLAAFTAPMSPDALAVPALGAAPVFAAPLPVPAALMSAPSAAVAPKGPVGRPIVPALASLSEKPSETLAVAFDGAGPAAKGDATEEYLSLMAGPPGASLRAADPPELRELRKYTVLLVPGFFSGAFIRLGNRTAWPGRRYFGDQIDWLEKMGIEYEMADVHTLQSAERNAPVIARAIESSSKPILAVTHSMGGNLLLHALITRPDLRARVRGWAPVQTPFLGSHVAGVPGVGAAAALLRLFGGTGKTVADMTPAGARAYYRRHRKEIAAVLRAVPVVAFASWVDTSAPRWLGVINPAAKWAWNAISRRGGRNDALIPVDSASLPGMARVEVPGVDHLTPFVETGVPFDRARFLKTMLTMVLRRAPGETPAP